MKENMGKIDRIVRMVVGTALIGLAISGFIGFWGLIGIIPVTTAIVGWCPAYVPFEISSCTKSDSCYANK